MSEQEKGAARAEGALAKFLADMREELDVKNRSVEYRLNFWAGIFGAMEDWQKGK